MPNQIILDQSTVDITHYVNYPPVRMLNQNTIASQRQANIQTKTKTK